MQPPGRCTLNLGRDKQEALGDHNQTPVHFERNGCCYGRETVLAYELGEEETDKQGIGMVELQGSMTTQPSVSKRLLEPFKFI